MATGVSALLEDAGRTVIGVDLLGHGDAPKPHDPAAYADLTERLVDALPAEGAVDAVGFSLGARTLLELATRAAGALRPDRARRDRRRRVRAGRGGDRPPDRRRAGRGARQRRARPGLPALRRAAGQRPGGPGRGARAPARAVHGGRAGRGGLPGPGGAGRPRLRRPRATAWPPRCPTPGSSRSATWTTSPRPSRSPSSTPCSGSSTPSPGERAERANGPSGRERRSVTAPDVGGRRGGAAGRRAGRLPHRDRVRARGRRVEPRGGARRLPREGPPGRPPAHRPRGVGGRGAPLGRGRAPRRRGPGRGVLARSAHPPPPPPGRRRRHRRRRPRHDRPAGAGPPAGPPAPGGLRRRHRRAVGQPLRAGQPDDGRPRPGRPRATRWT